MLHFKLLKNISTKTVSQTGWGTHGFYLDNLTTGVAMFIVYMFRGSLSHSKTMICEGEIRLNEGVSQTNRGTEPDNLRVISDKMRCQVRQDEVLTQTNWGLV